MDAVRATVPSHAMLWQKPVDLPSSDMYAWGRRAFQNGRAIAKAGAPEAMLAAMRDHMGGGTMVPQIPTAICNALRRIAVNDQICMEYADAGGVTVTMQVDTQRAAVTLAVTRLPDTVLRVLLACL